MKGITMMKTLFLFIFIFINTHVMSNMDKYIDFDIIESYKKPITMPAKYLEVFSVVYKDFFTGRYRSDEIESYIVNISESKYLYIIKFHFPWKRPVLGDGSGFYHIDKHTMKIIKVEFSS